MRSVDGTDPGEYGIHALGRRYGSGGIRHRGADQPRGHGQTPPTRPPRPPPAPPPPPPRPRAPAPPPPPPPPPPAAPPRQPARARRAVAAACSCTPRRS